MFIILSTIFIQIWTAATFRAKKGSFYSSR